MMKKLVLAYVLGMATVVLTAIALMWPGTPFQSMLLKHGIENGAGIVSTERFVVVYEGLNGDDAGAFSFTYAGRNGILPALWRGYGEGWSGGLSGITCFRTYDPDSGDATLCLHGKLLRVEDGGRFLRVQNQRLPLGAEKIVALVDEEGSCRQLSSPEAEHLIQNLPAWYRDSKLNPRPPKGLGYTSLRYGWQDEVE
jgi:hypothetical protein